jgi:hypothetical protein
MAQQLIHRKTVHDLRQDKLTAVIAGTTWEVACYIKNLFEVNAGVCECRRMCREQNTDHYYTLIKKANKKIAQAINTKIKIYSEHVVEKMDPMLLEAKTLEWQRFSDVTQDKQRLNTSLIKGGKKTKLIQLEDLSQKLSAEIRSMVEEFDKITRNDLKEDDEY